MSYRHGLFLLSFIPVLMLPSPSAAQAPTRSSRAVFLIPIEDMALPQLLSNTGTARMLAGSASALLSTRSGSDETDTERIVQAAYATIGNGRRSPADAVGDALQNALRSLGGSILDFGGIAGKSMGAPPGVTSMSCGAGPAIDCILAGRGPSVLLEPSRGPAAAGIASGKLDEIEFRLRQGDTAIVLTPFSTVQRTRRREFLGAITIVGPGFERGLLRSPTTRRDGLVTLSDVAPTILQVLGLPIPRSMSGRPIRFVPSEDPVAELKRLDQDLVRAARMRSVLLRSLMYSSALVALAVAAFISRRRRVPRALVVSLVAACAAPLAMLLQPVLPGAGNLQAASAWVAGGAFAFGSIAALSFGPVRGIAAVCGVTAVAVLTDLALGGPLASRSPVSYLLAEGARFYGIGNELMGVVVGGFLVAFVALNEEVRRSRLARTAGPLALALAVWLMASPSIGAKFGAVLTAVPAFGLLAARAGGRRPTPALVAVLEAGAAALTGLLYLADRLKPIEERSHIGGAAAAGSGALARKLGSALRLIALSFWMLALLAFIAAFAVVARTRREELRQMLEARLMLGSAVTASSLAIISAILFNDAGTIAAAFIALQVLSLFFLAFSARDEARTLAA